VPIGTHVASPDGNPITSAVPEGGLSTGSAQLDGIVVAVAQGANTVLSVVLDERFGAGASALAKTAYRPLKKAIAFNSGEAALN
jgi:hypothetical protein